MTISFGAEHDPAYGEAVRVTRLIRRVTANNPGKFTGTGTGTYLIGIGQVAVVDPGPADDAHTAAVLDATAGEEISHILVTHTHSDHSAGVRALQAATTATTYGFGPHPVGPASEEVQTEEAGDTEFVPDVVVGDGAIISGETWTVEALHTPGHISNHLCFALAEERCVFTGDHVMGWSTTVIPPPDGNMGDYLTSLRLLLDRTDRAYYPTHGPPITQPQDHVETLIAHRIDRERQIMAELAKGPRAVPVVVETLYGDVRSELHEAAGQSVLAHLLRLRDEGRVDCDGEPSTESVWISSGARRAGPG